MDLPAKYTERSVDDDDAEEEDDESESKSLQLISVPSKTSAPKTLLTLTADPDARNLHKPIDAVQHVVTYDQLWASIYGPAHPYAKDGIAQGMRNHKLGFVESAAIHPFLVDEQYNTFHKYSYAADPFGSNYVGDLDALQKNDAVSIYNIPQHEQKKRRLEQKASKKNEDEAEADAENPASEEWLKKNRKSPWAGKKEGLQAELTGEQKKYAEEYAEKEKGGAGGERVEVADKTTFHGKEERDYQGRSWITPPKDTKATNDHCYIPKRWVHTWSGHTKGVSAIRFFPYQLAWIQRSRSGMCSTLASVCALTWGIRRRFVTSPSPMMGLSS